MSPLIAARYKYGDTLTGEMGLICPQTPDMEIYHRKYHIKDICAVVSDAVSPPPFNRFTLVKSCLNFQQTLNLNVFTGSLLI